MTEPRDDDIKRLLDRAIGQEPALSLNRAEIFRAGRRKVRNRRLAASGGVAASVVAVVVGAATLTNLVGGTSDNDVTPAIGSSTTAPPAPTTPETPGLSLPLTTTVSPPSLPVAVQPEKHAAALTAELAASNPIPKGIKAYPAGDGTRGALVFAFFRDAYHADAHLSDARGSGGIEVEIAYIREPNASLGCEQSTDQVVVTCTPSLEYGYQMTRTTRTTKRGTVEYIVRAFRPDGTDIWVTANNASNRTTAGEVPPTAPKPLVDYQDLEKIAINPRLTYG
jgi:hypothetical protein